MLFIYIQSVKVGKKTIPYRITLKKAEGCISYNFRPEISIPENIYASNRIDRLELLNAPPFCDIANALRVVIENHELIFSDAKQYRLLKSQFKTIGYDFNSDPKYSFQKLEEVTKDSILQSQVKTNDRDFQSLAHAQQYLEWMESNAHNTFAKKPTTTLNSASSKIFNSSNYKMEPGVYFFLDAFDAVIYIGKAKQIRKRLQSHFSSKATVNGIDYTKVRSIHVEYTGNDIVAQLMESANIKNLKPTDNIQQVKDPAPYIISKDKTTHGIHKLQITRKDIINKMPERYFNRASVKEVLDNFCTQFSLCRKHCGLENVKGPCSNVTMRNQVCVCSEKKLISTYNKQFEIAFKVFRNRKTSKIYKLKGRHSQEDAFIYMVNGIYEGYGFIEKNQIVSSTNDILGHLIRQKNNYDTSRIVSGLDALISKQNVLHLKES